MKKKDALQTIDPFNFLPGNVHALINTLQREISQYKATVTYNLKTREVVVRVPDKAYSSVDAEIGKFMEIMDRLGYKDLMKVWALSQPEIYIYIHSLKLNDAVNAILLSVGKK